MAQTLRLFCVVVSVPFPAMQMLDETTTAVALEKVDELPWLALIPICFAGRFIGTKLDKDRLLALRPMIPNLLLGNAAMIASSVGMAFRLLMINFASLFAINWYFNFLR